jgi:lauroyl/myristoyl acyltransferase
VTTLVPPPPVQRSPGQARSDLPGSPSRPPAAPSHAPQADAPRAVAASPFHSIRARAGRFWFWLLSWNSAHVPWLVPLVTPFFVWGAWTFSPYTRLSLLANIHRVLGKKSTPKDCERIAKDSLRNFFRFVCDMGRNRLRSTEEMLKDVEAVEGLDRYLALRAEKRGAILAAAHMGPFETAVAGLRQHEPAVHVVFRRDRIHAFESLRAELHKKLGIIEAPINDPADTPTDAPTNAMGPWLRLRDALKRNEVVLLQADRVVTSQRGVRVPFCSGHLELPPGPIKLALASASPIVPVFSLWANKGKVRIIFGKPIEVSEPWPRSGIHPALTELARAIEQQVQQHPEQWLIYDPAFSEDQESSR